MAILDILSSGNYIAYNKAVARKIGIDEAILFGEFCSKQNIYGSHFYVQMERIEEDTCLTAYRIRNAMKHLKELGLLIVSREGIPSKNFYSIDEEAVIEFLELRTTSTIKFNTTGDVKIDTTSDIKIGINKEKTRREDEKRTQKQSKTVDEVIDESQFSEEVKRSLREFAEYREERKQPLTEMAAEKAINVLRSLPDDDTRIKSIDQSILNNWRGLFDVKCSFGNSSNDKRGMVQAHYEESYVPF